MGINLVEYGQTERGSVFHEEESVSAKALWWEKGGFIQGSKR